MNPELLAPKLAAVEITKHDIINRIGFALKAPIIDDQPNLLVSGYDVELEKKGSLAERLENGSCVVESYVAEFFAWAICIYR